MIIIKICQLKYITKNKYSLRYAEKLRGFFSSLYPLQDEFHNHSNSGVIYRMPLIQYKIIDGYPFILGLEKGADLIEGEFLKHPQLNLKGEIITDFETSLNIIEDDMLVDTSLYKYELITTWLALNEQNHNKYLKEEINLDKIMIANILSNLKGLDIFVEDKIILKGNFFETKVKMKNVDMIGFKGEFITNVKMPDYMGLGKRKSIGFGTIKRVDNF